MSIQGKKTGRQWWAAPFQSDNSWNVTWHTLLEYYPTASLRAIGWVLTFSFHGLVHEGECASCHTSGNPKINVASGSQPSSPLNWKWDLFPSQLSLHGLFWMACWIECTMTAAQLVFRSSSTSLDNQKLTAQDWNLHVCSRSAVNLINTRLLSMMLKMWMKRVLLQEGNLSEIYSGKQAKSDALSSCVRSPLFTGAQEERTTQSNYSTLFGN